MARWSVLAALLFLLPGQLHGQSGCGYETAGRTMNDGGPEIVIYDALTVTCRDGTNLRANSGRVNQLAGEVVLVGQVFYEDSVQTLTAQQATYNRVTGRVWAAGDVVFVNRKEGSTIVGPELEYLRETPTRPQSVVTAPRRPTLTLVPKGDNQDSEPLTLVGDEVRIVANEDLTATGNVVITRTDLEATSSNAHYNSATEELELRENAVITSEGREIRGDTVQATLREGALERVHALTNASLMSEDLEVTAPQIHLRFESDSLRQLVARVPEENAGARALAISRTFRVEADSLDALFADQLLQVVYAVGRARGETVDTTVAAIPPGFEPETPPQIEVAAAGAAGQPSMAAPGPGAAPGGPAPSRGPALDLADDAAADDDDADGDDGEPAMPGGPNAIDASDWIRGDTITAFFEPTPPDTAAEADSDADAEPPAAPDAGPDAGQDEDEQPRVELTRLIAQGSAKSLYHIVSEAETGESRRNINFVAGDRVELEVEEGQLKVANVTGLRRGIFLEAVPPEAQAPQPSAEADSDLDAPEENDGAAESIGAADDTEPAGRGVAPAADIP